MANPKKHPSNYMCWVFMKDKTQHPLKFPYVKSLYNLHLYLRGKNSSGITYHYAYINVYARKTETYLCRQYYDTNYIVDKPNF